MIEVFKNLYKESYIEDPTWSDTENREMFYSKMNYFYYIDKSLLSKPAVYMIGDFYIGKSKYSGKRINHKIL